MTTGSEFPTVTPSGQQFWWVVWNADTGSIRITETVGKGSKPATPKSGKVYGPYSTHADAVSIANSSEGLLGSIGLGINAGLGKASGGAVGDTSGSSTKSWYQQIGDLAGALSNPNTWIRVGEGVVGLILLDVGLKAFTGTSVTETAVKKTPIGRTAKLFK
jgi:hypothetical protein